MKLPGLAKWPVGAELHHRVPCAPTVSSLVSDAQRSRNAILPIPELSYITGTMRTPLITVLPALREFPIALHSSFPGLSVGADSASKCFYRHAQLGRPKLPWETLHPRKFREVMRIQSFRLQSQNQSHGQLVVSSAQEQSHVQLQTS